MESCLQELSYDPNYNGKKNTKNDHRYNGKVKSEILPFDTDVARQAADPMKFVMEEIN
jgi:hypothetical protein